MRHVVGRVWRRLLVPVLPVLVLVIGIVGISPVKSEAHTRASTPAAGPAPVTTCANLSALQLPNTTITATSDPGDTTTPPSCRVTLTIAQPPTAQVVTVWVYLPDTGWNGRFEGVGGGLFFGGFPSSLLAPLRQGFAAGATDAGNPAATPAIVLNADNTINFQGAADWGYLGIHLMTVDGKALVAAYYGTPASHAYFNGCSTGGRQGITEAQRYPDDYDGILAGSPVINFTQMAMAQMWPQLVMLENSDFLPPCKFQAAQDAVVKACDAVGDGVQDGVIGDPLACNWDPSALIGTVTPCGTITSTDANVIRLILEGPRRSDGSFMWYGLLKGTRFSGIAATVPNGQAGWIGAPLSTAYIADWLMQDPSWNWMTLTQAGYEQLFDQSYEEWNASNGSDNPDLRAYAQHGGKLLIWHGLADFGVMPEGTMDYYERVQALMGPGHTQQFLHLFMAPGVDHCGGGNGPQPTGQFNDLVNWVEGGKAPSTIDAVKTNAAGVVTEERPICAYPGVATYKGNGDPNASTSYRCAKATRVPVVT